MIQLRVPSVALSILLGIGVMGPGIVPVLASCGTVSCGDTSAVSATPDDPSSANVSAQVQDAPVTTMRMSCPRYVWTRASLLQPDSSSSQIVVNPPYGWDHSWDPILNLTQQGNGLLLPMNVNDYATFQPDLRAPGVNLAGDLHSGSVLEVPWTFSQSAHGVVDMGSGCRGDWAPGYLDTSGCMIAWTPGSAHPDGMAYCPPDAAPVANYRPAFPGDCSFDSAIGDPALQFESPCLIDFHPVAHGPNPERLDAWMCNQTFAGYVNRPPASPGDPRDINAIAQMPLSVSLGSPATGNPSPPFIQDLNSNPGTCSSNPGSGGANPNASGHPAYVMDCNQRTFTACQPIDSAHPRTYAMGRYQVREFPLSLDWDFGDAKDSNDHVRTGVPMQASDLGQEPVDLGKVTSTVTHPYQHVGTFVIKCAEVWEAQMLDLQAGNQVVVDTTFTLHTPDPSDPNDPRRNDPAARLARVNVLQVEAVPLG